MKKQNQQTAAVALVVCLALMGGAVAAAPADEIDGPVIGIDLGTTYSCVGVYKNGGVEIIANDQGNRVTPSYVSWDPSSGERLIGDAAKHMATSNPTNTVFDAKRLIGREFSDKSVQQDANHFPFQVVDDNGKPSVQVSEGTFAPEQVSAMVLGKMKQTAEEYLGEEVKHAVVTVPAYFNDAQRQATRDAGTIAGLNVVRIINEPTAAALAFGVDKSKSESNVLVFDLGGGTFDVTLLTIDGGVFEVLSTAGDTHLGGEDFDQRVMAYLSKLIKKQHGGYDVSQDARGMQRLRREVERAKRVLSTQHQARIEIEALIDGEDFSETLTRARFEELNADLFRKTLAPVKRVLEDAGLKKGEVDEIVLVGGSTRIPKVQQLVQDFFNGKEPNRGINPDEAVAYGAAVQAGILSPSVRDEHLDDMIVLDVTPLTLGIETVGGVMTKLVPRGSSIPTRKTQVFSTNQDNQDAVLIQVFQGERAMARDNHPLGRFSLTGLPPAPRGVPQIEVTFELDANGVLTVTAVEAKSSRKESVTIDVESTRLSEADIERMRAEAEEHAEEDRLMRERVTARIGLESYLYQLRAGVAEMDGVAEEDQEAVEEAVDEALDWLDANQDAEADEFEAKKAEVEAVANPVMRGAYGAGGGAGGEPGEAEEEEDEDWDSL